MNSNLINYDYVDQTLHESMKHGTNGMSFAVYKINGVYYHWHDEYEFIETDVESECIVNGHVYRLQPGDAFLINPCELHTVYTIPNENRNMRPITVIVVDSSVFSSIISEENLFGGLFQFQHYLFQDDAVDARVIHDLRDISRLSRNDDRYSAFCIISYFADIFATLFQNNRFIMLEDKSPEIVPKPLLEMLSYIEKNIGECITLDTLSEITHYTRQYIIKLFKKYVAKTPVQYITHKRIQKAKYDLVYDNKNIIDISMNIGFNSVNYFNRVFKRSTGFSPSEYRSMYLKPSLTEK